MSVTLSLEVASSASRAAASRNRRKNLSGASPKNIKKCFRKVRSGVPVAATMSAMQICWPMLSRM
jgi:hypothetical protein